jgi:ferredoxin
MHQPRTRQAYAHKHRRTNAQTQTYTCSRTHVHHKCIHAHVHVHAHTYTDMHQPRTRQAYVHMRAHPHTHANTHTYPQALKQMSTSCSGLIAKYAECIRNTECMKVCPTAGATALALSSSALPSAFNLFVWLISNLSHRFSLYSCILPSKHPHACAPAQEEHKSLKECMASKPEECEQFRYALFHCRKGQVDARTRIQGNKVRNECLIIINAFVMSAAQHLDLQPSVSLIYAWSVVIISRVCMRAYALLGGM